MLHHLSIKNLAIVDEIHIDLDSGMSVITGETGVGKSLMVDGLALIMGQRAESNLIGGGANTAEVSAVFDLGAAPAAIAWLDRKLIERSEDQAVVRRALSKTGPSRAFINGTAVTLAELKDFGALLIDIHAQHEHQVLLKKEGQRLLFDEFADAQLNAQTVTSLYEKWMTQRDALVALSASQQERLDRQRFLEYQLDELLKLELKPEEALSLDQELVVLANAEEDIALGSTAVSLVDNDNAEGGLERLRIAALTLSKMKDPRIESPLQELSRSIVQIEETHRDLTRILESSAVDPVRLRWVESRLGEIHDLCRKHRCSPEALTDLQSTLSAELEALLDSESSAASLEAEIAASLAAWKKAAETLSKKRAKAKPKLERAVNDLLHQMGMNAAQLVIALSPATDPNRHGLETIAFHIATQADQPAQALNKIASGGELSRISLAIQVATLGANAIGTMIFDEVDVGIGGGVAQTVGELLRRLSQHTQILCVTHLGQVAAQGHHHLKVTKNASTSQVTTLNEEERVSEIARMVGGLKITKKSLAHAQEMMSVVQT
ncbi:MAG: DNA repair protein RecN [Candidatus Azotimanducaceae bacterium]